LETNRLEAFSDGVFAVAITLLVLNLNAGPTGHGSLTHQITDQWSSYAAYLVSFMVIGIIWINHHTLFRRIVRVDRTMLFLNLLVLLFVSVIPFPTRLAAEYLRVGGWDAKVALAIYGAVMEGLGLSMSAVFIWGGRRPELLHESIDPVQHRAALRGFGIGSILYLVTIALAFVNAAAALAMHFGLAVFYVFDRTAADGTPVAEG
jgi:uncharacterized membrane protein